MSRQLAAIVVAGLLVVSTAVVLLSPGALAIPADPNPDEPAGADRVSGDVLGGTALSERAPVGAATDGPVEIDACRVIDQSGTYVLTTDIVSDPATTPPGFVCLQVVVDERDATVVIDGDGHALRSSGRSDTAVSVGEDGTTVVTDLMVSGWGQAFEADEKQGTRRGGVDAIELSNVVATDNRIVINADNSRLVRVVDSEFSNNGGGIVTEETTIDFVGLSVTDSEGSGVEMAQTSGTIVDSEFSNNRANGIGFVISGDFEFTNVVAAGNGRNGVSAVVSDTVTIVDSDLSGNGMNGLLVSDMLQFRFESNEITDNEVGVWLRGGSGDITLVGNYVADNAYAGIVVGEQFGSTVVSDNAFSNDRNVRLDPYYDPNTDPDDAIDPDLDVAWNVDPRPELNVVDGAFVGGNYYAAPDGDGFSETCVDADVDTLCDAPLELFDGAVDEHPLATPSVRADEPPTSVAPPDLRGVTFALDCGLLTGGQSVQFGYEALETVGIPPDAASGAWSNADVLDVVRDSPLGPAVELLGVDPDDLLWAANADEQVVRVFADTGLGVRSCTGTIVE